MSANLYVAELSARITDLLKPLGFSGKGPYWFRRDGDRVEMVNLQRSSSSTRDRVNVTLNIGLTFRNVFRFLELKRASERCIWDAHWHERIGYFTEKKNDKWWWLEDTASTQAATSEIVQALRDRALPTLEQMKEQALLALVQEGKTAGIGFDFIEYSRQIGRQAS